MEYLWLKTAHHIAVALFLGNMITGLFWKRHADRSGEPALMAHALRGITRSDYWFTLPSAAAILVTGFAAAGVVGIRVFSTGWIWKSALLLALSGVIYGVFVAPLQRRLERLAQAGVSSGPLDWKAYRRASLWWEIWGAVAVLAPLVAVHLMVTKRS